MFSKPRKDSMGMDRKVVVNSLPKWEEWKTRMERRGFAVQLRMIDGELAFPDETPPETWRELRVSVTAGMFTLRREDDGVRLVTWGNAGAELVQAWEAAADAFS